jgi:hypothetical protein
MPSDFEMEDSDSSNESLNIDPSILTSVTQGRPRVILKGKEYQRYYSARATRAPSVIWSTGEEYERNGKKHWRCGICKPERNRLSEESIEASECLENWWDRGLITQQEDAEVTHEGSDIEGERESEL